MRILFTGASSFTGMWFVRVLADAGHDVVAVLRRERAKYEGVRARRVEIVASCAEIYERCSFGDRRFHELIDRQGFDVLCHHAATVEGYSDPGFDAVAALGANTRDLASVLERLVVGGTRRVILTGSVFEADEGAGNVPLRAFNPYGLAKGLTGAAFRFYADRAGLRLGKFVIPNPFGPYEEQRFTAYLVRTWKAGNVPSVATPSYVRDNIHVSLLASVYIAFLESLPRDAGFSHANPSGYVESQGAFALRFGRELEQRLDIPCPLEFADQRDFPEPMTRVNTEPAIALAPSWDEGAAWDALAEYYC